MQSWTRGTTEWPRLGRALKTTSLQTPCHGGRFAVDQAAQSPIQIDSESFLGMLNNSQTSLGTA